MVLFLALISSDVFILYDIEKNNAIPNGMKRLRSTAIGPNGPVVLEPEVLKSNAFASPKNPKVKSLGRLRKPIWKMNGSNPMINNGRAIRPAIIQGLFDLNL